MPLNHAGCLRRVYVNVVCIHPSPTYLGTLFVSYPHQDVLMSHDTGLGPGRN